MALNKVATLVLVPTTSGTGSEVSPGGVITDTKLGVKGGLAGPCGIADFSVLDPELTIGMPPSVTAATGMDVLAHAIEALTNSNANTIADMNAEKAIYLVNKYLKRAYTDGTDMEARLQMQIAASIAILGGTVAGVQLGHSIGHSLGVHKHMVHGHAVSIMAPFVLKHTAFDQPEKIKLIANALGIKFGDDIETMALIEEVNKHIFELSDSLGIPKLKEANLTEEDIQAVAEISMKDIYTRFSPVPASVELIKTMLNDAISR